MLSQLSEIQAVRSFFSPRSARPSAQLLLAVHWPLYLNSGADLSWSLVAFMVARQVWFWAS
jgi:hypothetical protein